MGQKVHPTGIRLGIVKKHSSTWYAGNKDYADKLNQDLAVRAFINKKLSHASVSRIDIERQSDTGRVTIHTARPGIVIGKKGEDVERLRNDVTKVMGCTVTINIEEIRKPDLDASYRNPGNRGGLRPVLLHGLRHGRTPNGGWRDNQSAHQQHGTTPRENYPGIRRAERSRYRGASGCCAPGPRIHEHVSYPPRAWT